MEWLVVSIGGEMSQNKKWILVSDYEGTRKDTVANY